MQTMPRTRGSLPARCYDLADFATNDTERAQLANQGIAACRQLVAREPKSAPAIIIWP